MRALLIAIAIVFVATMMCALVASKLAVEAIRPEECEGPLAEACRSASSLAALVLAIVFIGLALAFAASFLVLVIEATRSR